MLKIHLAENVSFATHGCPMPTAVKYNFASQLSSADLGFEPHEGPLGIKCCFNGEELYEVEGRRLIVDETSYLVLNQGQRYGSALRGDRKAESFCIWFRPAFAEQVLCSLRTPADQLLEDPFRRSRQPVLFFERLYPHDTIVSPRLMRIRRAANNGLAAQPWLEEQFHLLLEDLLQAHRNIYRELERLPATREVTRVELYRRLHRAKDFLDSNVELPATLAETAEVACLSPHYFLRQFKHLFHETPHQYHRRRRLERARYLLVESERSVTDICFQLGFESLGSFSWLFRRFFGLSPAQYREECGRHLHIRRHPDSDTNGHAIEIPEPVFLSPGESSSAA